MALIETVLSRNNRHHVTLLERVAWKSTFLRNHYSQHRPEILVFLKNECILQCVQSPPLLPALRHWVQIIFSYRISLKPFQCYCPIYAEVPKVAHFLHIFRMYNMCEYLYFLYVLHFSTNIITSTDWKVLITNLLTMRPALRFSPCTFFRQGPRFKLRVIINIAVINAVIYSNKLFKFCCVCFIFVIFVYVLFVALFFYPCSCVVIFMLSVIWLLIQHINKQ